MSLKKADTELLPLWSHGEMLASGTIKMTPRCYQRMRSGRGFMYTPKEYADYKRALSGHLKQLAPSHIDDGPLKLDVWFFFADRRRRDYDNALKAFNDAANGVLWNDDSQVVSPGYGGIFVAKDVGTEPSIVFSVCRAILLQGALMVSPSPPLRNGNRGTVNL